MYFFVGDCSCHLRSICLISFEFRRKNLLFLLLHSEVLLHSSIWFYKFPFLFFIHLVFLAVLLKARITKKILWSARLCLTKFSILYISRKFLMILLMYVSVDRMEFVRLWSNENIEISFSSEKFVQINCHQDMTHCLSQAFDLIVLSLIWHCDDAVM